MSRIERVVNTKLGSEFEVIGDLDPTKKFTVSVGDTDGNVESMLRILHALGMISIPDEIRSRLGRLLKRVATKQLMKLDDIVLFAEYLSKLNLHEEVIDRFHIRWIGDTTADREGHDGMTMVLYKWMDRHISYTLVPGNHDMTFVLFLFAPLDLSNMMQRYATGLHREFYESACQLLRTVLASLDVPFIPSVKSEEFAPLMNDIFRQLHFWREMVINALFPHMRLIDYRYQDDVLEIYTHAPTSIARLIGLASLCQVDCYALEAHFEKDGCYHQEDIMQIIDGINAVFEPLFTHKFQIYAEDLGQKIKCDTIDVIFDFVQTRCDDLCGEDLASNQRVKGGLVFVHGHTNTDVVATPEGGPLYCNLDSKKRCQGDDTLKIEISENIVQPVADTQVDQSEGALLEEPVSPDSTDGDHPDRRECVTEKKGFQPLSPGGANFLRSLTPDDSTTGGSSSDGTVSDDGSADDAQSASAGSVSGHPESLFGPGERASKRLALQTPPVASAAP